jgi:hypothetical protein
MATGEINVKLIGGFASSGANQGTLRFSLGKLRNPFSTDKPTSLKVYIKTQDGHNQ